MSNTGNEIDGPRPSINAPTVYIRNLLFLYAPFLLKKQLDIIRGMYPLHPTARQHTIHTNPKFTYPTGNQNLFAFETSSAVISLTWSKKSLPTPRTAQKQLR